jgi:glycerol-3-phosphate acyltransferase PlsY
MEFGKLLGMRTILKRGFVHVFAGLSIAILAFLLPKSVMLLLVGSVTFVFLLIDLGRLTLSWLNERFQYLFKPFLRDYEASRLTGASCLLVACLVSITVFNREVAVLAISFLAIGDSLAGVVNEHLRKTGPGRRTLLVISSCFLGCFVAGLVWYYIGLNVSLMVVIIGAVCAAIVESLPLPIDDNITIPLLSGTIMWLIQLAV